LRATQTTTPAQLDACAVYRKVLLDDLFHFYTLPGFTPWSATTDRGLAQPHPE
jgi:hypothetical protein